MFAQLNTGTSKQRRVLAGALALQVVGYMIIKKIVTIEV